jgi:hypothetical protein
MMNDRSQRHNYYISICFKAKCFKKYYSSLFFNIISYDISNVIMEVQVV